MELSRLRIGNEEFLVSSLIERCPKSMMLRELVKNALEAADRSVHGSKRVEISPVLVDGTRKLAIWNTGPGMDAEELHRMCDIASSIGKENGLDQNFGMGAKVASLPSNKHGIRYRSCKAGRVYQVIMGKRNGAYGRLHQVGPDGTRVDVIDATDVSAADGRDITIDWTEVVLLGNSVDQDTVADPYDGSPAMPAGWIAADLYNRFHRLPDGLFLTLHEACHTQAGTRLFMPIGDRTAAFARHEAVPAGNGIILHYYYDAPDPDRTDVLMSERDALQPARSTAALIYRDELYDVRPDWSWMHDAPVYGIPFGARFFSVHIQLPDDFPLLPDGYRQFLRHAGDLQRHVEARQFSALAFRHRPGWLLELLQKFAPDGRHTDQLLGEMAGMFKFLRVRRRWWPHSPNVPKPSAAGAGTGAIAEEEYEVAPQIMPLHDVSDIKSRGMEGKAARFYPETHQLFLNASYRAFTDLREALEQEFAMVEDQEQVRCTALVVAEDVLTRPICRKLVYGLAKRDVWADWEVNQATSMVSLTLAADDHECLLDAARQTMRQKLNLPPMAQPGQAGVEAAKVKILAGMDERPSHVQEVRKHRPGVSMKIPHVIHLSVRNKDKLPDQFKDNLEIMHQHYEEYEFRISNDADIDDFVSTYDPVYYEEVFSRLPLQIMRVDAVRYLWMEAIGGIYFDFDIRLQKPWKPSSGAVLIEREWTFPHANDIEVSVHNCVFASTPGHPLWRHLLGGIAKQVAHDDSPHRKWPLVFDVTGPNAISRTITQERLNQTLDNVHILEPSYIYQQGLSKSSPESAFFIHQTTGSWK